MKSCKAIAQIGLIQVLVGLLLPTNATAQTFDIDTILYNGDPNKFVNLVYLGDGYQDHELPAFISSAISASDDLFAALPFAAYRNYFNVFAVKVNSNESGADHPRTAADCPSASSHPVLTADTYFNSTFDYFSIHRLVVATNTSAAHNVLLNNFPLYDNAFLLVNSPHYGGSGGWLATASMHTLSNEILAHEIGHSFADLADEYWTGDIYAAEKANMTQETNPGLVKWKNWIGYNDVGIYPHGTSGESAHWYRPHNTCIMRILDNPFCPVCQEAITLKVIEKFGTPVLSHSPSQSTISLTEDSLPFEVSIVTPTPNTIRTKWWLNGELLVKNSDSATVFSHQLLMGSNTLLVEVLDTTDFIRADNHAANNTFTVTWTINKMPTNIVVSNYARNLKVYPIPVLDDLVIEIESNTQVVKFEIFNAAGQTVYQGDLVEKTLVNTKHFVPGVYILALENGQSFEFRKIIKQ